jgi:hypothetical protein
MLASLLLVALATLTAAAPAPAAATVYPDPTQVSINSISYGGTGCPQGSIGSFISADRETFVPRTPSLSWELPV